MADCYYHGQSGPGSCPECIEEGRSVVYRGGVRITAAEAAATCALNEQLRQPGGLRGYLDGKKTKDSK